MTGETQIVRHCFAEQDCIKLEYEIPVAYKIEDIYWGSEEQDDPSQCAINERIKVMEDTGPFRKGDLLVLTEDERKEIEEDILNDEAR